MDLGLVISGEEAFAVSAREAMFEVRSRTMVRCGPLVDMVVMDDS